MKVKGELLERTGQMAQMIEVSFISSCNHTKLRLKHRTNRKQSRLRVSMNRSITTRERNNQPATVGGRIG